MRALAEIIAISQEIRSTNDQGVEQSRFIVTFQIGMETLHYTVFKRTEYLQRYPIEQDGYVKGAIGTLEFDVTSEIRYSKNGGNPYIQYNLKNVRWTAKVGNQPAAESSSAHLEAQLKEQQAMAAEQVPVNPETGFPF